MVEILYRQASWGPAQRVKPVLVETGFIGPVELDSLLLAQSQQGFGELQPS